MDFKDIIITIVIIAVYFITSIRKYKKQEAAKARQRREAQTTEILENEEEETLYKKKTTEETEEPKHIFSRRSAEEQNAVKNENYFSYEDLRSPQVTETETTRVATPHKGDSTIQSVDLEEENNPKIAFGEEEIEKAVIYSEILKRPNY